MLLAHIVAVLERDHRFVRDDPTAAALVAVPIVAGANEGPTLAARLQEVGFATATPEDSALAALAHETGGQPAPGRYGVIDVGAARTRLAIIDCRPNEAPVVVAREQISPGGRDFDDKLLAYFAPQWPPLGNQIESLARRATIEAFKRRFAEAWVDGQLDYATIETLGATQLRLSLDRDTFQSPAVAGPLIDTFWQEAGKFFDRHDPARALALLSRNSLWSMPRVLGMKYGLPLAMKSSHAFAGFLAHQILSALPLASGCRPSSGYRKVWMVTLSSFASSPSRRLQ